MDWGKFTSFWGHLRADNIILEGIYRCIYEQNMDLGELKGKIRIFQE